MPCDKTYKRGRVSLRLVRNKIDSTHAKVNQGDPYTLIDPT